MLNSKGGFNRSGSPRLTLEKEADTVGEERDSETDTERLEKEGEQGGESRRQARRRHKSRCLKLEPLMETKQLI